MAPGKELAQFAPKYSIQVNPIVTYEATGAHNCDLPELDRSIAVHPLVPETLAFFADLPCQLVLTHLNHTNPVLDKESVEREGMKKAGASIAYTGQLFSL